LTHNVAIVYGLTIFVLKRNTLNSWQQDRNFSFTWNGKCGSWSNSKFQ